MKNVIGIGELLWDVLPDSKKLGGAPCNFVYHAQKQGALGFVISAIGADQEGKEILEVLIDKNISPELIQINDKPTSSVDVKLNSKGVPEYTIHENVAWDYIHFIDRIEQKVKEADVICFGSLAQRNMVSRQTIEKILKCCSQETIIVFDVNLRQDYYNLEVIEKSIQLCNVLKLNEEELPIVCKLLGIVSVNEEDQIVDLIRDYNLKLVAFTKGSEGSLLMTPTERSYIKTKKVKVKDTVGAGDSFTAAMTVGFVNGDSLNNLHQKALELSAFVCASVGAMPEYRTN
ncbi:MAG: PfkB family carbohydrate kinase [Bacteroidetes bacterium]|nr:PfkB family carbohydrate kinase [Bacteroidota bacterium]